MGAVASHVECSDVRVEQGDGFERLLVARIRDPVTLTEATVAREAVHA